MPGRAGNARHSREKGASAPNAQKEPLVARIVLFFPPHGGGSFLSHVTRLTVATPPLGLLSLAAFLRAAGHDVSIIDGNRGEGLDARQWAMRLVARHPDYVGFSTTTASFLAGNAVCEELKKRSPDILTVFGGVHVSWGEEKLLSAYPSIDYIVSGEGELAFEQLIAGRDPGSIEGLIFRRGTAPRSAPARKTLVSMDDLPFPAYDLIDGFPRAYPLSLFGYRRHPGAAVISSRGCVYRCSYCDRSVFRKSFRWQSPEYSYELIRWLRTDFGVRHIIFYDDLFTLNRDRVERFCGLLRTSSLGVTFNCIVRIGHIDQELIALLRSAGCWMVHVGIESGDQSILDSHKEGVTVEGIRRDVRRLHDAGIWVKGLFMMGFPGETETSIRKTIDFACSLPLKDCNVTAFTPFPGAPVYQSIEQYGALEDDWSQMDCMQFVFVPQGIESRGRLEILQGEFIRSFYRRPSMRKVYRAMLRECPHSYWRLLKNAASFLAFRRLLGSH
jgi:radical SAM superfamily enzyme YgiQ (UPF0313 family)